jgi:hypothetical protein
LPGRFRFVDGLVFVAAAKREQRASDDRRSDSGETE